MADRRSSLIIIFVFLALVQPIYHAIAQNTPVVFIPGIMGSKLVNARGENVWGNLLTTMRRFGELKLPDEPDNPIRATEILDEVTILGPLRMGQYKGLLDTFNDIGLHEGVDLFLFPYDWRQSNYASADSLRAFIQSKEALRDKPINIVAHSMGGLVARIYLDQYQEEQQVTRLITMGTPFLGSLDAFRTFHEGLGGYKNYLLGGEKQAKRVVASFYSLYELLPSYQNCCILGLPSNPDRTPVNIINYSLWKRFGWISPEAGDIAEKALESARDLRALLDEPLPRKTKLIPIVGVNIQTVGQVYLDLQTGKPIAWKRHQGDGTVISVSASNNNPEDARPVPKQHKNIFNDEMAKWILLQALTDPKPIPYRGLPVLTVTRRDGTKAVLESIAIELADSYVQENDSSSIRVVLRDEYFMPITDVAVTGYLESKDQPSLQLEFRESDSGTYTAAFQASATLGVYRIPVMVPGLPVFEEHFVVFQ